MRIDRQSVRPRPAPRRRPLSGPALAVLVLAAVAGAAAGTDFDLPAQAAQAAQATQGAAGKAVAQGAAPAAAPASADQPGGVGLADVTSGINVGDVEFSPDSKSLLFSSNKSGRPRLWVMPAEGGEPRPLMKDEASESNGAWSPDGKRVLFSRATAGQSDLWTANLDGSGLTRLTNDAQAERSAVWSPDGTRVAYLSSASGAQDVWMVGLDGKPPVQLTEKTNVADETRWTPGWSPDGKTIAFVSNRSEFLNDDLWVVDVATKELRRVTVGVYVMSSPVWSPDGAHIAFNGMKRSEFWHTDTSDVYVADWPSRKVRRIEMNSFASDGNGTVRVAWRPDSKFLYFRYEWQGDANLWTVPLDGGVATQMTYLDGEFGNFAVAPDGSAIAFVRTTPTRGGEIHRLETAGGTVRALTSWSKEFPALKKPRKVTFRAKDGHYILGYLFEPPGFSAAGGSGSGAAAPRKFPALVQAHGGGTNAYGNGFHALEYYIASQGFVVLAIEYRGGSGHGREFQMLAELNFGADQAWDAVAAAEFLGRQAWSNGKVGMYGGSYGARMTMAAITRDSTPFAAVAPFYGSYDWEEAYPHGDRLEQLFTTVLHNGFKPGENPELYEHTAALRHLDKVKPTLPFLIIHGERDRRTPYMQALRLVERLKQKGHPVEFHSYPNEAHGFRDPKNRQHAYATLVAFFKKHLS